MVLLANLQRMGASAMNKSAMPGLAVPALPSNLTALDAQWDRQSEQMLKAAKSAEEYQRKLDAVNVKIREAQRDTGHLTQTQQDAVRMYTRLGLSTEDIGIKLRVSALAVQAFNDAEQREIQYLDQAIRAMAENRQETVAAAQAIGKSLTGPVNVLRDMAIAEGTLQLGTTQAFVGMSQTVQEFSVQSRAHMQKFSTEGASSLAALRDGLEAASTDFTQLAQISGGSFSNIARNVGVGVKALESMVRTADELDKIQTESGNHSAQYFSAMAASYAALAVAVYQWYVGMKSAHDQEVMLYLDGLRLRALAEVFQATAGFSDSLNASLSQTEQRLNRIPDAGRPLSEFEEQIVRGLTRISQLAAALNLSDIIKDLGGLEHLTPGQLGAVHDRLQDLFEIIAKGGSIGAQGLKQLDDVLLNIGKTAVENGGFVDQFFLDMIAKAKAAGVELKSVNDFLRQQRESAAMGLSTALSVPGAALTKRADLTSQIDDLRAKQPGARGSDAEKIAQQIKDLNAQLSIQERIIDATAIHSQAAASAVAGGLLGIIDANMKAGATFLQAVQAVGPSVQALQQQLDAAGLSGGAAFDFIRQAVDLANDAVAGPALQAVAGYTAGLVGLNNAGLLNQDTFAGIAEQIRHTHDELISQGYDSRTVNAAMQGDLQKLWEFEHKYGYQVDDTTQQMIDQAEAAGLVGKAHQDSTALMIEAINNLVTKLDTVMTKFFGIKSAIDDVPTSKDITFRVHTEVDPGASSVFPGDQYPGPPDYHTGGIVMPFVPRAHRGLAIDEVPIIAQRGEGILNRAAMRRIGGAPGLNRLNAGSRSDGVSVSIGAGAIVVEKDMTEREAESLIGRTVIQAVRRRGFRIAS